MRGTLTLVLTAVVVCGCTGLASRLDPFLGPTRAAPPGTGAIAGQPGADPYYYPGSSPTAAGRVAMGPGSRRGSTAPRWNPVTDKPGAQASSPSPTGAAAPTGKQPETTESTKKNDKVSTIPAAAASSAAAAAGSPYKPPEKALLTPGEALATGEPDGPEKIVRVIGPRPKSAGSPSRAAPTVAAGPPALGRPRRAVLPEGVTDIMDLPKAGSSAARGDVAPSGGSDSIRLVSGEEKPSDSAVGYATASGGSGAAKPGEAPVSFTPRNRYGYDPQYRWLKGELEYSQIDRRWKLRYIPIDGATDKFGGSVVLSDSTLLEGHKRGDFVEVRGRLGQLAPEQQGFAPSYELTNVKRLGD